MSESQARPIFIIGSPRSGTTLLRLILDAHPHISVGPETNFLACFAPTVTRDWERLALYGLSQAEWLGRIAGFFGQFQADYAARRGKLRWADKTPAYTEHLDFISAVFPDSQMIHIIRDGRDVVNSHRERWGYRTALRSVRKWGRFVTLAQAFGRKAPPQRYYEVRYEALVTQFEPTVRGLLAYLDEPWDEAVRDYARQPHDIQARYHRLTGARRQQAAATVQGPAAEAGPASTTEAVYSSRVGAWRAELPWSLRLVCEVYQRRVLDELGYR